MGWVTDDQIKRARKLPVLTYILRHESNEYKRVGRGYRLKSDDAFAVDEKGWYCHKRCIGGKTALDYLVEIRGYGLVEAVCFLLNESTQEHPGEPKSVLSKTKSAAISKKDVPNTRPPHIVDNAPPNALENNHPKPASISLPVRNKNNNRVIAYLQSRDIDLGLIMNCIGRGVLYECKYYHNAVFLGKDEHDKTRFAAVRSTATRFMHDINGSDKKYGFVIPPNTSQSSNFAETTTANAVAVFESPIEALSHQTMCLRGYLPTFDVWRLSLNGISTLGLEHFLEHNPQVKHCIVCTNNDDAGDTAMGRIQELEKSLGITVTRSRPPQGNDWNNALEAVKKAERTQHRGIGTQLSCNKYQE